MRFARALFQAMGLAGLIMQLIGLYYLVIKAGIPYQDPPPELQLRYAIHMGIGELLFRDGLLLFAAGLSVWLLLGIKQAKAARNKR